MFDFPIITIVIFTLLFIPPVLLGALRGWKASLFFALSNLFLIGIEIGLAYGLYDQLWGLFKGLYLSDLQKGISPEALKFTAKSSIVILFIGLCMLPAYGLIGLMYIPLKKPLKKYLWPKFSNINQNTKAITRSSHVYSRIAGATIGAASSLFFASAASTAVATVFVKKDNRYAFNDFTSKVTNIYTFGQADYNLSFFEAKDFINGYLSTEYQNYLSEAIRPRLSETPIIKRSIENLSSGIFHDNLLKFKSKEDTLKAIINVMTYPTLSSVFLLNDRYQSVDEEFNRVGVFSWRVDRDDTLDAINYYKTLPTLKWGFSSEVSDYLISKLQKDIKTFEETSWFLSWTDQQKILRHFVQKHQELINARLQALSNLSTTKQNLSNKYAEIDTLKSRIDSLGSTSSNVGTQTWTVDGSENSYQYVTRLGTPTQQQITNNGEIYAKQQVVAAAKTQFATKESIFKYSEGVFKGPIGIESTNNQKEQIMNNKKGELDQLNSELSWLKEEKTSLQSAISSLESRKTTIQNNLVSLTQTKIDGVKSQADNIQVQINTIDVEIAVLRAQITAEHDDAKLTLLNKQVYDKEVKKIELSNIYSQKINEWNNLKFEKSRLESELQGIEIDINNNNAGLQSKEIDITAKRTEITAKANQVSVVTNDYTNYHNSTFLPAKNDYDTKKAAMDSAHEAYNSALMDVDQARIMKRELIGEIQTKITEREGLVTQIYQLSDTINTIDSRSPSAHNTEDHVQGAPIIITAQYVESNTQDLTYLNYAKTTIDGSKDLIDHTKVYLEKLRVIKDEKFNEYNELKREYFISIKDKLMN